MKSTLTPLTLAAMIGFCLCYDWVMTIEVIVLMAGLYWVVLVVINFNRG